MATLLRVRSTLTPIFLTHMNLRDWKPEAFAPNDRNWQSSANDGSAQMRSAQNSIIVHEARKFISASRCAEVIVIGRVV